MALAKSQGPAESISTQSRLGTKLKIEFAPDRLRYTISDHSGSRTFDALYETLKVDSFPTVTTRRTIWRVRIVYAAIAIFLLAILVSNISKPLAGALVIVAVLLVPLYWLGQIFGLLSVTFTQIEMNPPAPGSNGHSIRILKDKTMTKSSPRSCGGGRRGWRSCTATSISKRTLSARPGSSNGCVSAA
jgi:hypothetical protein